MKDCSFIICGFAITHWRITVQTITTDIAVIGAGGAGLRTAIAAAESNPELEIALVSKVYPMRSHTVAAEGGSAAVVKDEDSLDNHFNDTVGGGDWLCEQDVVEHFVENATREMTQLEQWGCPWSRKDNGDVNVRRFGGMKVERTWFAADKTGFHMLHTLFQTSLKYEQIKRFDEYFVVDLLVVDGEVQGLIAIHMSEGEFVTIKAKSVVLATGGAGRVYHTNTNGGIVTGDGMAMAYRHGVPLRDMEFVQYHPTGLPGTGILMTEGCRGEGGIMVNKDGYRYLQDYGMGPETPLGEPKNKYMELGPRDKVSQAFWHEQQKGNTIKHPLGDVVHLDLRHLGEDYINERLPFICELAKAYVNVDPAKQPIPIRPTAHYTMGGIETDKYNETSIKGLFAVGECSSVGLHGANRLGLNSLAELVVFGRQTGEGAAKRASEFQGWNDQAIDEQVQAAQARIQALLEQEGDENWADIRTEMGHSMESGCGIYREEKLMQETIDKLAELKERYKKISIKDKGKVFNTDLLYAIEVGYGLEVAEAMAHSAMMRKESRGAHQRLDEGCTERDDDNYLKHSLAFYNPGAAPRIDYSDVTITKSQPKARLYGAAAEEAAAKDAAEEKPAEEQQ
jgi:fumarate reductase flavoprotein subunit